MLRPISSSSSALTGCPVMVLIWVAKSPQSGRVGELNSLVLKRHMPTESPTAKVFSQRRTAISLPS